MMPLAVADHRHHALADAILHSNFTLWLLGVRYFRNLRVSEFAARCIARSLFLNHVSRVLAVCPEPKVFWVDAESDVATVAYAKAVRNWSLEGHECRSMSEVGVAAVFDLPVVAVVLPRVEDAPIFLRRRTLSESLLKRFYQFWRPLSECLSHAIARTEFRLIQVGRRACANKACGAADASEFSSSHITLYHLSLNGGYNGYDDRVAKWEAAKEILA